MKILFKNCLILIRDDVGYKTLENAFLGVLDDKICFIGLEEPKDQYDVIKDMSNKLLMPGLINAHGHSPMTILRGVGSGLKLQDWLFNTIFPIEDKMVGEDIEAGCRLAALEMIRGGTTTFSEMYANPYSSMKAIAEAGLKMNVNRVGLCFDKDIDINSYVRYNEILDIVRLYKGEIDSCSEINEDLHVNKLPEDIAKAIKDDRIRVDFCIHSEYLTTSHFVKAIVEQNKKYNLPVNIHCAETQKEFDECMEKYGLTPVQYFDSLGLFDCGKVYAAHCVYVTEDDLKIMKEKNVTIAHNPTSNMKLGSGMAPIAKAVQMGVNVAIGTDGCASNNNLDMFEEMHIAALLQSGLYKDPTILTASQIIDMATINGAKALDRHDIGKLEVGYKADIIALDLNQPHLYPIIDVPSLIVYSAHGSDVCMTMVDGRILYEDGKYYSLDYDKVIKEAEEAIKRLL